jgi:hypothetical protein
VGNASATTVTYTVVDTTPPQVTCGSADGEWHPDDVSIECTATDSGSGVGGPATFALTTNVPPGTETDDAATNSLNVCDLSGNCTTAGPITGNKIDKKAPDITIAAPVAALYELNEMVLADYQCVDGGSGASACNGTVAEGAAVPTSTVGPAVFTVTATDAVGNTATLNVDYTVNYGLCLEYDPNQPKNAGATYVIKLRLCDGDGTNLSSRSITLTALLIDGEIAPDPNDAGNANLGFEFRFSGGSYIYNLHTDGLVPGLHTLDFTVVDGGTEPTHSAPFTIE